MAALETLSKAIGDTIDLSVGDIIAKYGDKRAIGLAAMKGEIDPTKAAMAGMAIDRIAASAVQPSDTTVAQDIFGGGQQGLMAAAPQQPMPQQMGRPAMPQRPPQMPQQMPQRPPQGAGLNQVPVPQRGFAGGGIIGFQAGGSSATLMAALDRVLTQLKARDPGLNVDYIKQSVLQAPPEQQQQLVSDLMNKVAAEQVPLASDTFTGAIAQRTVDPKVMAAMQAASGKGLTAQEMAIPSGLTSEYDYGAETMAGGVPEVPGAIRPKDQPGIFDYLAEKIMPRKQVMDPNTGKYVDVPPMPFPASDSPGLAGVLDQQRAALNNAPERNLRAELESGAGMEGVTMPAIGEKTRTGAGTEAGAGAGAAPGEITPEAIVKAQTEGISIQDAVKKIIQEQADAIGIDPRIAARKEALEAGGKRDFTDRLTENALLFQAGEKMRRGVLPGEKTGEEELAGVMGIRGARKKEELARKKELADLEGSEFEKKKAAYERVTKERREDDLIKEKRAFELEKQLKDLTSAERRTLMRVEGAIAAAKARGSFDYKDAATLVTRMLAADPSLVVGIQKRARDAGKPVPSTEEIRDMLIRREMYKATGVSGGEIDTNNPLLQ